MARRDSVGEVPPVPWRTVVGSGIAGEAKLDHLRLVSLGMRCWQDMSIMVYASGLPIPTPAVFCTFRAVGREVNRKTHRQLRVGCLVFRLAHWRVGKLFHKQQNAVPMASCC
ncbi:zinc finger SWIM domain-containing protein [Escherichia coli]|uniref:Zinc finger SWIM domain-containing protein n=1 Tax=Escherichia coli TaxID=562 RepID=A0A376U8P4_ECOLX|nr:zinc finger SWIM domain-containing protein [Escherichia coli]